MIRATATPTGGGAAIRRRLARIRENTNGPHKVFVGIPTGMSYPDGTSLGMVARVHEFGSADGTIPERSYLRSTLIYNADYFKSFWGADNARDFLNGQANPARILGLLGAQAEGMVKQTIIALADPANTDATIAAKGGKTNPLVDTGQLSQSIRYEVDV